MTEPTSSTSASGRPLGVQRSPGIVLLLSIVTLGIYFIWWYYTINNELKQFDPTVEVNPPIAALALFIPIANIISSYNTALRLEKVQTDAGQTEKVSPVVAVLWFIFLGIIYPYYVASKLEAFWASQA